MILNVVYTTIHHCNHKAFSFLLNLYIMENTLLYWMLYAVYRLFDYPKKSVCHIKRNEKNNERLNMNCARIKLKDKYIIYYKNINVSFTRTKIKT